MSADNVNAESLSRNPVGKAESIELWVFFVQAERFNALPVDLKHER